MQIAQEDAAASAALGVALPESSTGGRSPYSEYKLIRRNAMMRRNKTTSCSLMRPTEHYI